MDDKVVLLQARIKDAEKIKHALMEKLQKKDTEVQNMVYEVNTFKAEKQDMEAKKENWKRRIGAGTHQYKTKRQTRPASSQKLTHILSTSNTRRSDSRA